MLNFIKENTSNAVKLFVNQIAMAIFGLSLSAAVLIDSRLTLAAGILSVLFYYYLLYTAAWDIGARDKIKVDGGRMKYQPLKGLYISLLANSLNIILGVVYTACYLLGEFGKIQTAADITAVTLGFSKLLNGVFACLLSFVTKQPMNMLLLFATIIPTAAVSALSYFAGLKNFRLFGKLKNRKR